MKDVTLKREQLKKIDYPHELPADTADVVKLSPETLLLSIAISQKRIADALEDGLTALDGDKVKGVADLIAEGTTLFAFGNNDGPGVLNR